MSDGEYLLDTNSLPPWSLRTRAERLEGPIDGLRCRGCGHEWPNKTDQPAQCPSCGSGLVWEGDDESALVNLAEATGDEPVLEIEPERVKDALDGARVVKFADRTPAGNEVLAVWHGGTAVNIYAMTEHTFDNTTVFNVSQGSDRDDVVESIDEWFEAEDLSELSSPPETDDSSETPSDTTITIGDILGSAED